MFTKVTLKVKFEPAQSVEKVKALAEGIMALTAAATALNTHNPLPDGVKGIDIKDISGEGFVMEYAGWQDLLALDEAASEVEGRLETQIDALMCDVCDLVNAGCWKACQMSYKTTNKVEYEDQDEASMASCQRAGTYEDYLAYEAG